MPGPRFIRSGLGGRAMRPRQHLDVSGFDLGPGIRRGGRDLKARHPALYARDPFVRRTGGARAVSHAKAEPWVPRMKRGMTVESWRTRLPAHIHAPPRAPNLPRRNTLPQTTPLRGHASSLLTPPMQVRATKITTPKTTRLGGAWSGVRAH